MRAPVHTYTMAYRHAAPANAAPLPAIPPERRPQLASGPADTRALTRAEERALWAEHVAAGRIGTPAAPPAGAGDHRLAGLAAILGLVPEGAR